MFKIDDASFERHIHTTEFVDVQNISVLRFVLIENTTKYQFLMFRLPNVVKEFKL